MYITSVLKKDFDEIQKVTINTLKGFKDTLVYQSDLVMDIKF